MIIRQSFQTIYAGTKNRNDLDERLPDDLALLRLDLRCRRTKCGRNRLAAMVGTILNPDKSNVVEVARGSKPANRGRVNTVGARYIGMCLASSAATRPGARQHPLPDARIFGAQVFGRRDDETIHALWRPASEKRQGTKSRWVTGGGCCGRQCARFWKLDPLKCSATTSDRRGADCDDDAVGLPDAAGAE